MSISVGSCVGRPFADDEDRIAEGIDVAVVILASALVGKTGAPVIRADMAIPIRIARTSESRITSLIARLFHRRIRSGT